MSVTLSHELGHRRCTKVDTANVCVHDVSARHWLAHLVSELRPQLVVPLLLVPSTHAPSPRQQVRYQELPPLVPIHNCEAHSKFFALTPVVHSSRTVVFQQLSGRGLERGTWSLHQCSVSEVVRPTDMLGCSCIHQKLYKLTFSHPCIIRSHHKLTEPARLRVSLHQGGDRSRRGLRSSSQEVV